MCGRYTLIGPARLRERYPEYAFEEFSDERLPRFNVAPAQTVFGVLADGSMRVRPLRWGLGSQVNARAETILQRTLAWRCILFADGFYEWREGKPHHFSLADESPFALAGVYEPSSDGQAACAIVTVPANDLVAVVHHRMPAVLTDAQREAWLTPGDLSPAQARPLLAPYPAAQMRERPASTRLNGARYDAPDVLADDDPVQQRLF
jgi:putative SOS response-associated peptidase YedK